MDRAAQRGIRAAEAAGDTEAAQNIRDALSFRLGEAPAEKSPQTLPPTNTQGWSLMKDAQGNRAYVGPNGEIEEVQ